MLESVRDKFNPKKTVLDLDAIIEKSQYVRFQGKVHEIKPILVEEFFSFANSLAAIQEMKNAEKVTVDMLVEAYYSLIYPACPTVTKDMIRASSHAQIYALIQFVLDHVSGRMTDEKKKTLTKMEFINPLSL